MRGFTLTELILVLTLLAILAVAATAAYQNMTTRARYYATQAIVTSVRSAIMTYRSREISSGRASGLAGSTGWPSIGQVCDQSDNGFGVCTGTVTPKAMEDGVMPNNPFAGQPGATHFGGAATYNNLGDGNLLAAGAVQTSGSGLNVAWYYKSLTGDFWANSSAAGENQL